MMKRRSGKAPARRLGKRLGQMRTKRRITSPGGDVGLKYLAGPGCASFPISSETQVSNPAPLRKVRAGAKRIGIKKR